MQDFSDLDDLFGPYSASLPVHPAPTSSLYSSEHTHSEFSFLFNGDFGTDLTHPQDDIFAVSPIVSNVDEREADTDVRSVCLGGSEVAEDITQSSYSEKRGEAGEMATWRTGLLPSGLDLTTKESNHDDDGPGIGPSLQPAFDHSYHGTDSESLPEYELEHCYRVIHEPQLHGYESSENMKEDGVLLSLKLPRHEQILPPTRPPLQELHQGIGVPAAKRKRETSLDSESENDYYQEPRKTKRRRASRPGRFRCTEPKCSETFTRKNDVKRHAIDVHEGQKAYCRPGCGKGLSRDDSLARHRRTCKRLKEMMTQVDEQEEEQETASLDGGM